MSKIESIGVVVEVGGDFTKAFSPHGPSPTVLINNGDAHAAPSRINITTSQAQAIGPLVYRKVRITIEAVDE